MRSPRCLMRFWATGILFVVGSSGCASLQPISQSHVSDVDLPSARTIRPVSYRGQNCDSDCAAESSCACGQIERGKPHKFVDGTGWFLGIPDKILLWDSRVENHQISPDTEYEIQRYLATYGLSDVKVRLNQYAPGSEWGRLRDNSDVGAGWRYTAGAVSVLAYTLLPGRLIGGDSYNPFTNTINLYSDVPSIAIHEAAYARDNARRRYRGTYGALQHVAGINIWHETIATRDALGYIRSQGSPTARQEANRILHPLYGSRIGGAVGGFLPNGEPLLTVSGAIVGHAAGRAQNLHDAPDDPPTH